MRSFNPSELLRVWENGLALTSFERGHLLAHAAQGESEELDFSQLSIGQRDGMLIKMRQQLFGSDVVGLAQCPACNGQVELSFSLNEIPLSGPTVEKKLLSLFSNAHKVVFRLPTMEDLTSATEQSDGTNARQYLLSRCIIQAEQNGEAIDTKSLPSSILEEVERKMSDVDSTANIYLAVSCPACNHQWDAAFDVANVLWQDIHAWALRLLREVHQLAQAYGWREADILSLSAQRRSFYLELINQ